MSNLFLRLYKRDKVRVRDTIEWINVEPWNPFFKGLFSTNALPCSAFTDSCHFRDTFF